MKTAVAAISLLLLMLIASTGCTTFKRFGYEGFKRDEWQHPDEVIRTLAIRLGDHIADLGAGGGYFTFRLADATGPHGRVYAVDVDGGMTDYLQHQSRARGYSNVETILARYDDPLLPESEVDLIFVSNAYHHISARSDYFTRVKEYLAPDGRVAVIELDDTSWFSRISGHLTSAATIRAEMEAAGYRVIQEHHFLPKQSFMLFSIANGATATE